MVFEAAKFFFVSSQSRHLGFVTNQVARIKSKSELDKCFVATSRAKGSGSGSGSGSQIWTSLVCHKQPTISLLSSTIVSSCFSSWLSRVCFFFRSDFASFFSFCHFPFRSSTWSDNFVRSSCRFSTNSAIWWNCFCAFVYVCFIRSLLLVDMASSKTWTMAREAHFQIFGSDKVSA